MKPAYFGQCSCCINIHKNNYPEETELDTNPSLTLARTLTLSTGEQSLRYFTSIHWNYDTTIFNFAYMNSQYNLGRDPESRSEIDLRRKITTARNWQLENENFLTGYVAPVFDRIPLAKENLVKNIPLNQDHFPDYEPIIMRF